MQSKVGAAIRSCCARSGWIEDQAAKNQDCVTAVKQQWRHLDGNDAEDVSHFSWRLFVKTVALKKTFEQELAKRLLPFGHKAWPVKRSHDISTKTTLRIITSNVKAVLLYQ